MTFLDLVNYAGCTWSASLREDADGHAQLIFRALSREHPIAGCISPVQPTSVYVIRAATLMRPFLLEDILAREME